MVMGPTHATSGAVAWLAGGGAVTTVLGYSQSPAELAVYTAVCAGAALLPDLDVSGRVFRNRGGATAAKVFGFPSLLLAECVEKLSLGVYLLTRTGRDRRRRQLGDMITHHGCPLLWPVRVKGRAWYVFTTPRVVSVRAGGGFEKAVLLPRLTIGACAAAAWQVPEIAELLFSLTGSTPDRPEAGDSP